MPRSHAIWHSVRAGDYVSSRDFGSNYATDQTIYVGRGSRNSHELARVEVRECYSDKPGHVRFNLLIDSKKVKTLEVDVDKTGRVTVESDLSPLDEASGVGSGYKYYPDEHTPTTMTVGRLMKRLAVLVLKGRGDEPILINIPKRIYHDGQAGTPRIVFRNTDEDHLVMQIQRI